MTYEVFKATLLAELKGTFPPDTTIMVHTLPRNNQVAADGLTILESGFNISPTIYIQEYYEDMQKGMTFSEVFQEILNAYYHYRPTENIDPSFFRDFQNVSPRIAYKLVNYHQNQELLRDIPHVPFMDLAIVFYCLVTSIGHANATILINNEHLRLWHIQTESLYALARENTPTLMRSHFEQMSFSTLSPIPMYVLTNESRYFGAACMLYDKLLEKLSESLSADFYIIPSSIHEVILVPFAPHMKKDDFDQMVREVNSSQLQPEEVLADHVYYFSRRENRILM